MLTVLAGFDPHDPASENVPIDDYPGCLEDGVMGWRVAAAGGEYFESSDREVLAAVENAERVFKDLGATVEKEEMSWLAELGSANGRMTQADGAAFHRERLMEHPDWFGADVLQRLQSGSALSSSEYALARRLQAEGRRHFEIFFEKYDILILPTTPVTAPTIQETGAIEAARQLTRFTSAFNLTGLPALSVPCGFSKEGLPMGIQIVSKHWAESKVLQAGYAFEQATEWHKHFPNL